MKISDTILASCIALAITSCNAAGPATPKTYTDTKRGLEIQYPADWSVEDVAQEDVLLLMSPVREANWQTNVFLEVRRDEDPALPHDQRLGALAAALRQQKKGFALQGSRVFTHPSGLPAGELLYSHTSQGVPLTEREVIVWLTDQKVVILTGSAVTSLWAKYQPQISVVQDSVHPLEQ